MMVIITRFCGTYILSYDAVLRRLDNHPNLTLVIIKVYPKI